MSFKNMLYDGSDSNRFFTVKPNISLKQSIHTQTFPSVQVIPCTLNCQIFEQNLVCGFIHRKDRNICVFSAHQCFKAVSLCEFVFLPYHLISSNIANTLCFSMNMFRKDKGSTATTPVVPARPSKEVWSVCDRQMWWYLGGGGYMCLSHHLILSFNSRIWTIPSHTAERMQERLQHHR